MWRRCLQRNGSLLGAVACAVLVCGWTMYSTQIDYGSLFRASMSFNGWHISESGIATTPLPSSNVRVPFQHGVDVSSVAGIEICKRQGLHGAFWQGRSFSVIGGYRKTRDSIEIVALAVAPAAALAQVSARWKHPHQSSPWTPPVECTTSIKQQIRLEGDSRVSVTHSSCSTFKVGPGLTSSRVYPVVPAGGTEIELQVRWRGPKEVQQKLLLFSLCATWKPEGYVYVGACMLSASFNSDMSGSQIQSNIGQQEDLTRIGNALAAGIEHVWLYSVSIDYIGVHNKNTELQRRSAAGPGAVDFRSSRAIDDRSRCRRPSHAAPTVCNHGNYTSLVAHTTNEYTIQQQNHGLMCAWRRLATQVNLRVDMDPSVLASQDQRALLIALQSAAMQVCSASHEQQATWVANIGPSMTFRALQYHGTGEEMGQTFAPVGIHQTGASENRMTCCPDQTTQCAALSRIGFQCMDPGAFILKHALERLEKQPGVTVARVQTFMQKGSAQQHPTFFRSQLSGVLTLRDLTLSSLRRAPGLPALGVHFALVPTATVGVPLEESQRGSALLRGVSGLQ